MDANAPGQFEEPDEDDEDCNSLMDGNALGLISM